MRFADLPSRARLRAALAERKAARTEPEPDPPERWPFVLGFTIGVAIAGGIIYALLRGWFH